MNAFLYLLIGAPLVIGFILRVRLFEWEKVKHSMGISATIFAMVAVGYAFSTYVNLPPLKWDSERIIGVSAVPAIALAAWVLMRVGGTIEEAMWAAGVAGVATGIGAMFLFAARPGLVGGAIATYILVGAGLLNGLLGPIVAGFTLSATLYGFIVGDGLKDIFFWKDLFEFFKISTPWFKVVILVVTSFATAAETIHAILE